MTTEKLSKLDALALNNFFAGNPTIANKLIKYYGSTEAIASLPQDELQSFLTNKYANLFNKELFYRCEKEIDILQHEDYHILTILSDYYPSKLRECPDAPFALYIRSKEEINKLFNRPLVSIVGTRKMSLYGKEWTRKIVHYLSKISNKPIIVSGLAYGIDITAHLAALEFGLSTIGVSPVGITDIYPQFHRNYCENIINQAGAIISDFPIDSVLYQSNFLRRNRIIAGLSDNTIVVESRIRGGAMMTARLSNEYNRGVFAIPGRIDDVNSEGCNSLITKNMASCIASLDDLGYLLGLETSAKRSKKVQNLETSIQELFGSRYSEGQVQILLTLVKLIQKYRGINLDELCTAVNMPFSQLSQYVALLEKEGFITTDLLACCTINKIF